MCPLTNSQIVIKEVLLEEAFKVHRSIPELKKITQLDIEKRYKGKEKLILVASYNNKPVGYCISYDRYEDGSFYSWIGGVTKDFRRMHIYKALREYQEKWVKQKGYTSIKIKTKSNNRIMLWCLKQLGYNIVSAKQIEGEISNCKILLEKKI